MESQRKLCLTQTKIFIFELFYLLQNNQFLNKYLLLIIQLMELGLVHYFYANPIFIHLKQMIYMNYYFNSVYPYYFLIVKNQVFVLTLIILSLAPLAIILIIFTICATRITFIIFCIEIILLCYPLLIIKLGVEISNLFNYSLFWISIGIFLSILSFIFLLFSLFLQGKPLKLIDFLLVGLIELKINSYALLVFFAIRIIIYIYYYRNNTKKFIQINFELGFFIILITTYFSNDSTLNSIIYLIFIVSLTFLPLFWMLEKQIDFDTLLYDQFEDNLQIQMGTINLIEKHYYKCENVTCLCKQFPQIQKSQKLYHWVLKIYGNLLQSKQSYINYIKYVDLCFKQFQGSLKGLINFYKKSPQNLYQQYIFYKICKNYQSYLRNRDLLQNDIQYQILPQEIINFQRQIYSLIDKVTTFWITLQQYDGSSKFIDLIVNISIEICLIRQKYIKYLDKYDDSEQFKFIYKTFKSIIHQNQQKINLQRSNQSLLFISSNQIIIKINRRMLNFLQDNQQNLLNISYKKFIPSFYRSLHQQWVLNYLDSYNKLNVYSYKKPILMCENLIKMVQMTHNVIPRFSEQIQIITNVKPLSGCQKAFHILINIDNFEILCIELEMLDILKLPNNEKNINKILNTHLNELFPRINKLIEDNFCPDLMFHYSILNQQNQIQQKLNKQINKNQKIYAFFNATLYPALTKSPLNSYRIIKFQEVIEENRQVALQNTTSLLDLNNNKQQKQKKKLSTQQKNQTQTQSFKIPIYLILGPILFHILYTLTINKFKTTLQSLQNRNNYWLYLVLTCLDFLGVQSGSNQLFKMKQLWIKGYGYFPQIFIGFQHLNQNIFYNQTLNSTCKIIHNQLSNVINQAYILQQSSLEKIFKIALILIGLFMLIALIDLILNLYYVYKIEKKVSQIIVIFLRIKDQQIKNIINIMKNIKYEIKNNGLKDIQDNDLDNGILSASLNSSNSSLQLSSHQLFHQRKIKTARKSRFSVLILQKSLLLKQSVRNKNDKIKDKQLQDYDTNKKVQNYQQKYSCFEIIQKNKIRLLLIFCSNGIILILFIILVVLFCFIFSQIQFSLQFTTQIWKGPIIFLKSISKILLQFQLQPNIDSTEWNNNIKINLNLLPKQMINFKDYFNLIYNSNNCQYFQQLNQSQCIQNSDGIFLYGQKIIFQNFNEKLRQQNKIKFYQKNFNTFIKIQMNIFQMTKNKLISNLNIYIQSIKFLEQIIIIVSSSLILICLIMMFIGLNLYRNKIKDTQSLLSIIPKRILEQNQSMGLSQQLSIQMTRINDDKNYY